MKRPLLFPLLALVAVGACTSSNPNGSNSKPIEDSAAIPRCPPPANEPPRPPAPTVGPKFCELPGADAPEIKVPEGFCVREYTTTPVTEARVIRFAPNGDLFVSAPSQSTPGGATGGPAAIVVLPDDDHDGRADATLTFAGGAGASVSGCTAAEMNPADLSCVHGITFSNGYLYYTRSDEIRRFPYARGDRKAASASGELVATLGGTNFKNVRWTHGLDVRGDGRLLVSRGRYEGTACSEKEMTVGTVFAVDVAGTLPAAPAVLSDGFRNPLYLRCRPGCGDCYANELSGDGWGGIGGHEKLVLLQPNTRWGFPCCVERDKTAPGGDPSMCGGLGTEHVVVPLHDTPFGLDFETGKFGAPYTYGVFSALHGSVGDWKGTGISWAATDPKTHAPTGTFEVFASGWGQKGPLKGRATDVTFAPDGRLFVTDDMSGRIFWIAPWTLVRQ